MADGSAVLLKIGDELAGRRTQQLVSVPEPATIILAAPIVRCVCGTEYTGKDIERIKCGQCDAILPVEGTYLNDACPYCVDSTIPLGKCHCGCGRDTPTYSGSKTDQMVFKGARARFVHAHHIPAPGVQMVDYGIVPKPIVTPQNGGIGYRRRLRDFLIAHAGRKFTRHELADVLSMPAKKVSDIMCWLDKEPGFSKEYGVYWYSTTGTATSDNEPIEKPEPLPASVSPALRHGSSYVQRIAPFGAHPDRLLSKQALILFDLLKRAAKSDGRVYAGAIDLVRNARRTQDFKWNKKFSQYVVRRALTELHDAGCVDATKSRIKFVVRAPNQANIGNGRKNPNLSLRRDNPERNLPDASFPQSESVARKELMSEPVTVSEPRREPSVVDQVDEGDLARSIAEVMWSRYDWALSEIGRLSETVALQREQINRLTTLVDEMGKPSVAAFARAMIADASADA